jgi:hypothetical protein
VGGSFRDKRGEVEERSGGMEPVGGSCEKKGSRAVVVVVIIVRMLSSIMVAVEHRRG